LGSRGESPPAKIPYPQARSILQALPDLGASYLAQVPQDGTLIERMIAAAVLAIQAKQAAGDLR
jgi:hypothetical protein